MRRFFYALAFPALLTCARADPPTHRPSETAAGADPLVVRVEQDLSNPVTGPEKVGLAVEVGSDTPTLHYTWSLYSVTGRHPHCVVTVVRESDLDIAWTVLDRFVNIAANATPSSPLEIMLMDRFRVTHREGESEPVLWTDSGVFTVRQAKALQRLLSQSGILLEQIRDRATARPEPPSVNLQP